MTTNTIPVLYLFENVFYPETIIPLILSDEPSKELVREAYQEDSIVALYSTHPRAKGVATTGRIVSIDEKPDGKLSAVIVGLERIMLTKIVQHIPYPKFEFQRYLDSKESQIIKSGAIERLHLVFENWICRHITNPNDRAVFLKEITTPKKLANNISLFMIKDIELKLIFLESTSVSDRLNILNALLLGEDPESEDREIAEAIKNFEALDVAYYRDAAN